MSNNTDYAALLARLQRLEMAAEEAGIIGRPRCPLCGGEMRKSASHYHCKQDNGACGEIINCWPKRTNRFPSTYFIETVIPVNEQRILSGHTWKGIKVAQLISVVRVTPGEAPRDVFLSRSPQVWPKWRSND